MSLTARAEGEVWTWEYPSTVEADTAQQLNREDVTIAEGQNWCSISVLGLVIFLLGIIIWLLWKNKKPTMDT